MTISEERLTNYFAKMSKFTAPGEGITRVAFGQEDWQARAYVIGLMKAAGLVVRIDNFGNVIGRREGLQPDAPAVMFGSHIDSVPYGGNFDGVVGVLGAIEVINCMNEADFKNDHPIELVVFMSEESSRFAVATLGSKTMCGHISVADLKVIKDKNGKSLYEALKGHGLDADNIDKAIYKQPLKAFMELHIEQGRVLESTQTQIGIVTGIAAPTRLKIIISGKADHSGATPMNMRNDGLCAAAEIILKVEELTAAVKEPPAVGTVGIVHVTPSVMNVIPGKVELGVDIRSINKATKAQVIVALRQQIEEISARRSIPIEIITISDETPVQLKTDMIEFLAGVCKDSGSSYRLMPSGAGHDAMHWAPKTHTGMMFIPCKDGVSHSPAEWADIKDIMAATDILYKVMCTLSRRDFQW